MENTKMAILLKKYYVTDTFCILTYTDVKVPFNKNDQLCYEMTETKAIEGCSFFDSEEFVMVVPESKELVPKVIGECQSHFGVTLGLDYSTEQVLVFKQESDFYEYMMNLNKKGITTKSDEEIFNSPEYLGSNKKTI